MRLGVVRGTVTLNLAMPTLEGLRLEILAPDSSERLAAGNPGGGKCLIAADQFNACSGPLVGVAEWRTAARPWYPNDIPVDAYCCLIVENCHYAPPVATAPPVAAAPREALKPSAKKTKKVRP